MTSLIYTGTLNLFNTCTSKTTKLNSKPAFLIRYITLAPQQTEAADNAISKKNFVLIINIHLEKILKLHTPVSSFTCAICISLKYQFI